ncbi:MAG: response regulator [Terriglobia bacterium]
MRQRILKDQSASQSHLVPLSEILLVDNDKEDLLYHTAVLEGQGHRVTACLSFSAGAELAERGNFDLVIVGQGSPAFEGRAVIERLRANRRQTPVLVLAWRHDMSCYLDAMNQGAVEYLEKPVHPAEMRLALRKHLQPSLAGGADSNASREDFRLVGVRPPSV